MKPFTQEIVSYLKDNRVCVLAVALSTGVPHASTVHYAYDEASGLFVFETHHEYRKLEPFQKKPQVSASLVVGSDERTLRTLQVDGVCELLSPDAPQIAYYMDVFPEKQGKYEEQKLVFFTFTPHWWRFTDWAQREGKRVDISE